MELDGKSIGQKIKERRLALGYSLQKVADAVGVAKPTVQRWETGTIEKMKYDKIIALSQFLLVPPAYLLGLQDNVDSVELARAKKKYIDRANNLTLDQLNTANSMLDLMFNNKK